MMTTSNRHTPVRHTEIRHPQTGWGLGLRTQHYPDYLAQKQPLDWLEIITDNFLVKGGRPLIMLDRIRRDYPIAMHGVAMSIGRASGISVDYLKQVKALADKIEPIWVSDHLCWTAPPGDAYLHDLYPLPYTDEAARHIIAQIRQAQDILQRRLVVENLSSYVAYHSSHQSEWEFLSHIANEADCLLLVDVNNIYVSSVNHKFDPLTYLKGLPAHRVQQIHLAGHSVNGENLIDTHDQPICAEVWDLFAHARRLFGPVATMIERDDNIPPLAELLSELQIARDIAIRVLAENNTGAVSTPSAADQGAPAHPVIPLALDSVQKRFGDYILDRNDPTLIKSAIWVPEGHDPEERLAIYHNAFRARLAEVLAEVFPNTALFMSTDVFDEHAREFAQSCPPASSSLAEFGAALPDYLAQLYPDNPELSELAQIEWRLRNVFDAANPVCLLPNLLSDAVQGPERLQHWLSSPNALQSTVSLLRVKSNAAAIWNAIQDEVEVPAAQQFDTPHTIMIWRKELQPCFQTLDAEQVPLIELLLNKLSMNDALAQLEKLTTPPDTATLGLWFQQWMASQIFHDPWAAAAK